MLRSILFTHDDLDGAGCTIVYKVAHMNFNDDDYRVINCSNSSIDEDVENAMKGGFIVNGITEICFGDIVCSREIIERLQSFYPDSIIRIWDHHITNVWVDQLVPDATVIPKSPLGKLECGTSLMFQFYSEDLARAMPENYRNSSMVDDLTEIFMNSSTFPLLPNLVDAIRSYDTWEWKETQNITAKKLNVLMYLLGLERFTKGFVERIKSKPVACNLFSHDQEEILDAKLENEQKIIDNVISMYDSESEHNIVYTVVVPEGLAVAFTIAQCGANVSELATQFLTKHPEFDIYAAFSMYDEGGLSFRTIKDDVDVSEFAKLFGGGGHAKAAGAPLVPEVWETLADMVSEYFITGDPKIFER